MKPALKSLGMQCISLSSYSTAQFRNSRISSNNRYLYEKSVANKGFVRNVAGSCPLRKICDVKKKTKILTLQCWSLVSSPLYCHRCSKPLIFLFQSSKYFFYLCLYPSNVTTLNFLPYDTYEIAKSRFLFLMEY